MHINHLLRLLTDAQSYSPVFQALFCPTGHRAFAIGFVITVGDFTSITGHCRTTEYLFVPFLSKHGNIVTMPQSGDIVTTPSQSGGNCVGNGIQQIVPAGGGGHNVHTSGHRVSSTGHWVSIGNIVIRHISPPEHIVGSAGHLVNTSGHWVKTEGQNVNVGSFGH